MLYHVAYVSAAREVPTASMIQEILEVSRRNNARDGITGLMMSFEERFFQILEGEKEAVLACYARITRDPRHREISLIWEDDITERAFGQWEMALTEPTRLSTEGHEAVRSLASLSGDGARLSDRADPGVGILIHTILGEFRHGGARSF